MVMGVGLLVGAFLARIRRFRQHAWYQSVIVLVNILLIVLTMLPSFRVHVAPKIPLKLGKSYYGLATAAHATLGTLAELGGLYILLAVGTRLLPPQFRISNYSCACALYWHCGGPFCCWGQRLRSLVYSEFIPQMTNWRIRRRDGLSCSLK
jgi:hypothetical protein